MKQSQYCQWHHFVHSNHLIGFRPFYTTFHREVDSLMSLASCPQVLIDSAKHTDINVAYETVPVLPMASLRPFKPPHRLLSLLYHFPPGDGLMSLASCLQVTTQLSILTLTSSEQATTAQSQKKFLSHFSSFFIVHLLSVVLWLDKGDFPENWHFVSPCHNK